MSEVQALTESVLHLIRDAVQEAHDNIVAVSIVYVESTETVQAHVMATETLNQYAHVLAERIRDWDNTHGPFTAQTAAEHIDPNTSEKNR